MIVRPWYLVHALAAAAEGESASCLFRQFRKLVPERDSGT